MVHGCEGGGEVENIERRQDKGLKYQYLLEIKKK